MKITDQVWEFAEPLVQACGCSLWDVEYVREGGEWFLRLYLDKEGGVDIDDCEAVSRAVDPVLDEKDPIPESLSLIHIFPCCALLRQERRFLFIAAVPHDSSFGLRRTFFAEYSR